MEEERRVHRRVPLLVEVAWEGATGKYEARICDVSTTGCFIDTIGRAAAGETIRFTVRLPAGDWIKLQGEVIYELPRAGFGVRFANLSDDQRQHLEAFIKAQEQ